MGLTQMDTVGKVATPSLATTGGGGHHHHAGAAMLMQRLQAGEGARPGDGSGNLERTCVWTLRPDWGAC